MNAFGYATASKKKGKNPFYTEVDTVPDSTSFSDTTPGLYPLYRSLLLKLTHGIPLLLKLTYGVLVLLKLAYGVLVLLKLTHGVLLLKLTHGVLLLLKLKHGVLVLLKLTHGVLVFQLPFVHAVPYHSLIAVHLG